MYSMARYMMLCTCTLCISFVYVVCLDISNWRRLNQEAGHPGIYMYIIVFSK